MLQLLKDQVDNTGGRMGKPSEAWLVLERTAKSRMQKDCLCWYFKVSLFFDQPAISSSLRMIQPLANMAKRARLWRGRGGVGMFQKASL